MAASGPKSVSLRKSKCFPVCPESKPPILVVLTLNLAARRAGYNDVMRAAVLHRDKCSTMRWSPRARSVGSASRCVRKKVVTTTFAYDNNGNVTQKTTDGITTRYLWDYANRLIALGVGGATTTYGYDALGQRVLQTGTSTTTVSCSEGVICSRSAASDC
jgi:hypothetical protein